MSELVWGWFEKAMPQSSKVKTQNAKIQFKI